MSAAASNRIGLTSRDRPGPINGRACPGPPAQGAPTPDALASPALQIPSACERTVRVRLIRFAGTPGRSPFLSRVIESFKYCEGHLSIALHSRHMRVVGCLLER